MDRVAQLVTGRRSRWVILAAWVVLALALAPLQGALQTRRRTRATRSSPRRPSRRAPRELIEQRFDEGSEVNTVIAYTRAGGLTPRTGPRSSADADALCAPGRLPSVVRVITPTRLACGSLESSVAPSSPAVGPVAPDGTPRW